jgi:hypothetical protein
MKKTCKLADELPAAVKLRPSVRWNRHPLENGTCHGEIQSEIEALNAHWTMGSVTLYQKLVSSSTWKQGTLITLSQLKMPKSRFSETSDPVHFDGDDRIITRDHKFL